MARRRYLIAYDIANPARLRTVIKLMEDYGTRLQYSVFLCDLSGVELFEWRGLISSLIELRADSVVIIDLGPVGATAIEVLGVPRAFPQQGPTII